MKRLLCITALLSLAGAVHAGEWQVDRKAEGNEVKFTSEVVTFTFEGVTDKVDGYIYWEGEELFSGKNQLLFEVDLNALDTGIGKRDRDMRKVLATEKWPKAVFKGEIVQYEKVDSTVVFYRGKVKGRMALHGVEKEMEIPGTITVEKGLSLVTTRFTLRLEDFEIEAPSLAAFVKVSQEIVIDASFYMKQVK